jgi:hypothetical protein
MTSIVPRSGRSGAYLACDAWSNELAACPHEAYMGRPDEPLYRRTAASIGEQRYPAAWTYRNDPVCRWTRIHCQRSEKFLVCGQ